MPIRVLIIVLLAAIAVSGCGRRGSLEAPQSVTVDQSPSEVTAPADPNTPVVVAPEPAPQRRFFLDFLL